MNKKLVIVGDGETAEMAYEYFTYDSPYDVVAFAVEAEYARKSEFAGLPVVHFEEVERLYPPGTHEAFAAISYTQLNRVRARLYQATKAKGYILASYVSSKAFVWRNVEIGENCFLGVNSCIANNIQIAPDCVIGMGAVIHKNTEAGKVYVGNPGKPIAKDSFAAFNVPPETD